MTQQTRNVLRAFLQGMTRAGLFRRPDYPAAPKDLVDSPSIELILGTGEFEETCRAHRRGECVRGS
jgi:hypothetical protein